MDYLFCRVCKLYDPCRRIPSGGSEVQDPGCTGEGLRCKCCLTRFCFGSREQFPVFDLNLEAR